MYRIKTADSHNRYWTTRSFPTIEEVIKEVAYEYDLNAQEIFQLREQINAGSYMHVDNPYSENYGMSVWLETIV